MTERHYKKLLSAASSRLITAFFRSDIGLNILLMLTIQHPVDSCAPPRARILSARPANPTASCYLKTSLSVGENRGILVESLKTSARSLWLRQGKGGWLGEGGVGGRTPQCQSMKAEVTQLNVFQMRRSAFTAPEPSRIRVCALQGSVFITYGAKLKSRANNRNCSSFHFNTSKSCLGHCLSVRTEHRV